MQARALSIGLLATMLAGCQDRPAADTVLSGELTAPKVEAAIRSLKAAGGGSVLVITSAGGDDRAALVLGDFVRANGVEVRVPSYCLTTCAQFVAMAAPELEVSSGSLIGFHQPAVALAYLYSMRDVATPDTVREAATISLSAYRRWGIERNALLDQFGGLEPSCVGWSESDDVPRYQAQAQIWVPTRSWFERARGKPLNGWWPERQRDVDDASHKITQVLPSLVGFRFGAAPNWRQLSSTLIASPCHASDDRSTVSQ